MIRLLPTLVGSAFAAATLPSSTSGQAVPPALAQFLTQTIALNRDEMAAVSSGTPVVKVLEPADRLEIAVFGIVRVDVPRTFYVRRASDFPTALRSPTRVRFGVFSDPAVAADVAAWSLPHDDVEDLLHCRAGACKLKLPADAIARVQEAITKGSPSADSLASAFFRERIVEYVTAYRARGDSALVVYGDQQSPAAAAQVLAAMLSRSPYMYEYAPSLARYLAHCPNDRPADGRDVIYWAEDAPSGAKSTFTIAHEVVYGPPELPGVTFIATKQLYADHYLDGALSLTAIVDAPGNQAGQAGIYLAVLRRAHLDAMPSSGPINLRGKVVGGVRDRTVTWLRETKTQSEGAYANAPASAR